MNADKIPQCGADVDQGLSLWTIYNGPSDFPGLVVARRFVVNDARPKATADVAMDTLERLRAAFERRGYTRFMRSPQDDPKIVETWL